MRLLYYFGFWGWVERVGWRQQVSSCRNPTDGFAFLGKLVVCVDARR